MDSVNEWKEAVIDFCVIDCIGWYEDDPRKTLAQLCAYEQDIALDPRVSRDAQKIIDDTIDKCSEQIDLLLSAWNNLTPEQSNQVKQYLQRNLLELKGNHHGIGCKGS